MHSSGGKCNLISQTDCPLSKKPILTSAETIAKTRIFRVERISLRFDNGNEVEYERLRSSGAGAVLVVPLLDARTVILIREYVAGMERYEISFPKGIIDPGETPEQAADREIKEEIGYGAHRLKLLKRLSVAPGYSDYQTHIVLATDLYSQRLPGDEPEDIEALPWAVDKIDQLLRRDDFVEARSIAALYLLQHEL